METKINLIYTKDKQGEFGFVFVNIKEQGKLPRRVSTKIKITRVQFDSNRNKHLPIFNQTNDPNFNADALNRRISEITASGSIAIYNDDFINYYETKLIEIESGATQEVYENTLHKMKRYYSEIRFSKINDLFMFDFKNKLKKEGLKDGQIKIHIGTFVNFLNRANDDLNLNLKVNISKLKLKKSHKSKDNLLDDADVFKLIEVKYDYENPDPKKNKEYAFVTLGLCQLFGCGARFSDIIFLRWSDFKKDNIQVQTTKTKVYKTIPYSVMLLKTLYRYIHRSSSFAHKELKGMEFHGFFKEDSVMLNWFASEVVRHAKEQVPNEFVFKEIIKAELNDYYTSQSFTREEYRLTRNLRTNYNIYLKNFSIENDFQHKLSSHGFRYRFVANQLDAGTSIHIISKFLGHTSITTTEAYISRNYEKKGTMEMLNVADSKYINRNI